MNIQVEDGKIIFKKSYFDEVNEWIQKSDDGDPKNQKKIAAKLAEQFEKFSMQGKITFGFRYCKNHENQIRGRVGKYSGWRTGTRDFRLMPDNKIPKGRSDESTCIRYYDMGRMEWRSFKRNLFVVASSFYSTKDQKWYETPEQAGFKNTWKNHNTLDMRSNRPDSDEEIAKRNIINQKEKEKRDRQIDFVEKKNINKSNQHFENILVHGKNKNFYRRELINNQEIDELNFVLDQLKKDSKKNLGNPWDGGSCGTLVLTISKILQNVSFWHSDDQDHMMWSVDNGKTLYDGEGVSLDHPNDIEEVFPYHLNEGKSNWIDFKSKDGNEAGVLAYVDEELIDKLKDKNKTGLKKAQQFYQLTQKILKADIVDIPPLILKGCLMLDLKCNSWYDLLSLIDVKDIYNNEASNFGLEFDPHCTILYGFNDSVVNLTELKYYLQEWLIDHQLSFKIEQPSYFENKYYDVLKFGIDSETLRILNHNLKQLFEYENNFPDYKPHITIAYLKPGTAKKYLDLINIPNFNLDKIIYSGFDKTHTSMLEFRSPF